MNSDPNIQPQLQAMCDVDPATAVTGKRLLWKIVRQAGRPHADAERASLVAQLINALSHEAPAGIHRELLWMLSEIGGDESVDPIAVCLRQAPLREDARMALERIPGDRSLTALKMGFETVPEEFKWHIAQSLRRRGVVVDGYDCQKLVPTRATHLRANQASGNT